MNMADYYIYFLLLIELNFIGLYFGFAANPYITLLNVESTFANNGQYQCYPTDPSTSITFGKVFRIADSDSLAEQIGIDQGAVAGARRQVIPPSDGNFFGVYYCKGVLNGEETTVYTSIVDLYNAENSIVTPTNQKTTITASVGESVSVSFTVDSSATGNHIWRKDGDLLENYEDMYDQSSLDLQNVGINDAGIYELYIGESSRLQYQHSFIELIVRGCAVGRWGPGCTGICNNCYNGGICDDKKGGCICAPGFRGTNCEITCGGNRFGINCEMQCTRKFDSDTACRDHHYCLPKPFGCDCVTGYRGLKCNLNCLADTFGSGCSQQCHCQSGGCDQYTGECDSGGCAPGWSGTNCQVPDICPVGYYGSTCTSVCHCLDNVECDKDTGACSNGECAIGYKTYNTFCEECVTGRYGLFCALTCNCQDSSCHHETGCNGGCYINWLPDSCTTGIINTFNTQVNPGQSSTFQCDIQGDVTDVVVQLIAGTEPVDEFQRSESNGITRVSFYAIADMLPSYTFSITYGSQSAFQGHTVSLFSLPTYSGTPVFGDVTGSTVEISWREWSKEEGDTGDPPVVGYFVYHKTTSTDWSKSTQVTATRLTVTGLEWETQYSFTVSAVREGAGGEGPIKNFSSMPTICGEPLSPNLDVQTSPNNPKQIDISWQPLTINEAKCSTGVESYTVSYWPTNERSNDLSIVENSVTSYTIKQLQVYTEYTITVTARNKDFAGEARMIQQYSPEQEPPVPDVTATHKGSYLNIYVVPSKSYGLNLYGNIINYELRCKFGDKWMNETITKDQGSKGHKITNAEKIDYEVSARVINGAGAGNWSVSQRIHPQLSEHTGDSKTAIIGSVIGIVLLLLCIVILASFILWRRRRLNNKDDTYATYHQESTSDESYAYLNPTVEKPTDKTITPKLENESIYKFSKPQLLDDSDEHDYQNVKSTQLPINVKDLPDLVIKKRLNPLDGLKREYEKLPKGPTYSWEVAMRPVNRTKNRFKNIMAYDHSRVVLKRYEDDLASGYINACYVDGYEVKNNYIAGQSPNSASLLDFWRMIWQENVTTIVMLTTTTELNKEKCKKYWLDDQGKTVEFGQISILLEVTESYADYKIRSFKVWKEKATDFRHIKQYHFTSWPDTGVPLYATAALNFHKKIKSDNISTSAPVLVHCSSGIGQTAVFICIDSMVEMIDREQKVDVFSFVEKIRNQRVNMVQNPDQYVFIYDTLLEYSLCGDTTIKTSNFKKHLSKLKHLIPKTKKIYIEEEFEILQRVTPYPNADHCKVGHLQTNCNKNRISNIVPIDQSCPFLVTESSTGGNEYINASLVDGYKQKDKFIVTQMSLPNTVEDIWRLFFDWNVRSVVMLNDMDPNDASCAQYWMDEDGGTDQFGPLFVTLISTERKRNITIREFSITNEDKSGDDASCVVHMYQVHGWAVNQDVPEEPDTLLQVLELVNNNQHDYHHGNHPIVVHCIDGIGRSGIYCTIAEVLERMRMDNVIDVFQTLKKLRSNRPGLVQNVDQYIFCYDIISSYLKGFTNYVNV